MDFREYKDFVKKIKAGKHLPDAVYLHESVLPSAVPPPLLLFWENVVKELNIPGDWWNIIKLYKRDYKIALLFYPRFFDESYPPLMKSYTVNLQKKSCRVTDFSKSTNPPILHRKELFLDSSHPMVVRFQDITKEGEGAGLYETPRNIGFKLSWERLISRKGYLLVNGRLKPKGAHDEKSVLHFTNVQIERHLTAINRDTLSAPMQSLARHNYLNGDHSVFDYGCGKGDDVRELEAHGHEIYAWDPVYRQETEKVKADIVNLGFVINVIECRKERDKTIKDAFGYAKKVLVISAMLGGHSTTRNFTTFGDGVITGRNTFQKYFSQSELKSYIEVTLKRRAVAVSPGIFYVFRDEVEEQLFLLERQQSDQQWKKLSSRKKKEPKVSAKNIIEKHRVLFDDFWKLMLELGRPPASSEFDFSEQIRSIAGSHIKATNTLLDYHGEEEFEKAKERRKSDLLVYFALNLAEDRKQFRHLPEGLKRDIKFFWENTTKIFEEAKTLLYSVGKPHNIASACSEAFKALGAGVLNQGHSYIIHRQYLNALPPVLRTYVGCSTLLFGDLDGIDLAKIHMTSRKVSLMVYDDFEGKPLPLLTKRIKIDMRARKIDFFEYGGKYASQPLYLKSTYILEDFPNYKKQVAFDEKLKSLDELDLSGFGPSEKEFKNLLAKNKIGIKVF